eukprot:Skav208384  [mRNA]  locus=scaffold3508:161636:166417:+ [translate_table: standard]
MPWAAPARQRGKESVSRRKERSHARSLRSHAERCGAGGEKELGAVDGQPATPKLLILSPEAPKKKKEIKELKEPKEKARDEEEKRPKEPPKKVDQRPVCKAELQRHGSDREIVRSCAKAAERIASTEQGMEQLIHVGAMQSLQAWQTHRNDTALTVHVHSIVARFWDRASGDNQWICSAAQMAVGKEWLAEAHRAAVSLHEKGCKTAAMELYRMCIEELETAHGAVPG